MQRYTKQVLQGEALVEHAEKHGLCTRCGKTTVKRRKNAFSNKWEALTVIGDNGMPVVYKGYHIDPFCYDMTEAQQQLGEIAPKQHPRSSLPIPRPRQTLPATTSSLPTVPNPHSNTRHHSEPGIASGTPSIVSGARFQQEQAFRSHAYVSSSSQFQSPRVAHPQHQQQQMPPPPPSPTTMTPGRPVVQQPTLSRHTSAASIQSTIHLFETLARDRDTIRLLNAIDSDANETALIVEGFSLFKRTVFQDQMDRPNGVSLGTDGWLKTIKKKVVEDEHFSRDRTVVLSGLSVLLGISALHGRYKLHIAKRGFVDMVMGIFEKFQGDPEVTVMNLCLINSLCCSEKESEGLNAKIEQVVTLIRKLVSFLTEKDQACKDLSIRILYHL